MSGSIGDSELKSMLKSYIERVERLEEAKAEVSEDIKEVYQEVKSSGLVPKIVRAIIRKRKKDKATIQEEEALIDLYEKALDLHA